MKWQNFHTEYSCLPSHVPHHHPCHCEEYLPVYRPVLTATHRAPTLYSVTAYQLCALFSSKISLVSLWYHCSIIVGGIIMVSLRYHCGIIVVSFSSKNPLVVIVFSTYETNPNLWQLQKLYWTKDIMIMHPHPCCYVVMVHCVSSPATSVLDTRAISMLEHRNGLLTILWFSFSFFLVFSVFFSLQNVGAGAVHG